MDINIGTQTITIFRYPEWHRTMIHVFTLTELSLQYSTTATGLDLLPRQYHQIERNPTIRSYHGSKTRPSRRRVSRVVPVSARSETSPSHESVDSTQKRLIRPRIGVDSVDSADSRPNRSWLGRVGRVDSDSHRVGSKCIHPWRTGIKKKKKRKNLPLSLRSGDRRHCPIVAIQCENNYISMYLWM